MMIAHPFFSFDSAQESGLLPTKGLIRITHHSCIIFHVNVDEGPLFIAVARGTRVDVSLAQIETTFDVI